MDFHIIIRLYKLYDKDLIYLVESKGFDFKKNMVEVLRAAARGEKYTINLPQVLPDSRNHDGPYVFTIYIQDSKSIELIKKIKPRHKNSFCKNLLRNYLESIPFMAYISQNYFENGDIPAMTKNNGRNEKSILKDVQLTEKVNFSEKQVKPEPLKPTNDVIPITSEEIITPKIESSSEIIQDVVTSEVGDDENDDDFPDMSVFEDLIG